MRKLLIFASMFLISLLIIACGPYGPGREWEYGHMMNFGFGYGGMFMWILFLIVLGLAIYFIVQALKAKDNNAPERDTPLNILKTRYAKGDITKEEFERMKKDIE